MEFVEVEDGMQIGQPLTIIVGSTKTGKSVLSAIIDETARINPEFVSSDFELEMMGDIVANINKSHHMNVKDAIEQFWHERLNNV